MDVQLSMRDVAGAMAAEQITAADVGTLVVLAVAQGRKVGVHLRLEDIAARAGRSVWATRWSVRRLRAAGFISVRRRDGRPSRYVVAPVAAG